MPFIGLVDWDPESARSLMSGAGTEIGRAGREPLGTSSSTETSENTKSIGKLNQERVLILLF